MNTSEWDVEFIDILFSSGTLDDSKSKYLEKGIIAAFQKGNWHAPYEIITDKIYEGNYNCDDLINQVGEKFNSLDVQNIIKNNSDINMNSDSLNKFIIKMNNDISRHIRLSNIQKNYINKNVKNSRELMLETVAELESIKKTRCETDSELKIIRNKTKETYEELKKVQEIKKGIYTDFIAILGIFSALLFGMFGGFDSLKEILSNLHNTSISTTLICFSSLMLGLLCLIFLLVQSIAKLTGKDTLGCEHHEIDEHCSCSIIRKYPVFIYSMLLFSTVLIISCVIRFFDHNKLYKAVSIYWIIAVILTIVILFVFYKIGVLEFSFITNKKKKHSH